MEKKHQHKPKAGSCDCGLLSFILKTLSFAFSFAVGKGNSLKHVFTANHLAVLLLTG